MSNVYNHILIVLLIIGCVSCINKQAEQTNNQEIQTSQGEIVSIDTTLSEGIPPSDLKECLPTTFRGAEKLPSSSGSVIIEGIKVSKTTGEYIFPGGTITITLADYAGAVGTVLYRYDLPKNPETGMEIQSITLPNGYGYSRYSPNESTLHMYCLINKRVAAEIIANGTDTWFSDQTLISSLIPSDCIVKKITSTKQ